MCACVRVCEVRVEKMAAILTRISYTRFLHTFQNEMYLHICMGKRRVVSTEAEVVLDEHTHVRTYVRMLIICRTHIHTKYVHTFTEAEVVFD